MKHRNPGGDEEETQIDISPLIDCVFILLIFFIVTTRFIDEKGIEVDKPQPSSSANNDSESENLVFTVTEKGKILLDNIEMTLTSVQTAVERATRRKEDAPVIVQAEALAPSGTLVKVIDAAKLGGALSVSLANAK
jgi:biopolymer transport protein ExbD